MITINLLPQSIVKRRVYARTWARENYEARVDLTIEAREKLQAADRARYTEHRREQQLESTRRFRYRKLGITIEIYNEMAEAQGHRCACCGATKPGGRRKFWCVDHDHKTGAIRGLLCATCNAAIGFLGDGIEGARNALAYLEKHYEKGAQ